jgi:uncharacterized membrane protein
MNKFFKKIIWLIIIAPAVYLAIEWNKLPERVPIHFNLKGIADRYGSKNELIILIAVLSVLVTLVYLLLPLAYKIDPKKTASANKNRIQMLALAVAVFMSFITCLIIASSVQGNFRFNIRLVFAGVALLFCIIGNYMHNIKPNYFAGLRLPWTLNNEENWRKTHLLAGKLWFAGGLLAVIPCLLAPVIISIIIFFTIIVVLITIPVIYSYKLYRSQNTLHPMN